MMKPSYNELVDGFTMQSPTQLYTGAVSANTAAFANALNTIQAVARPTLGFGGGVCYGTGAITLGAACQAGFGIQFASDLTERDAVFLSCYGRFVATAATTTLYGFAAWVDSSFNYNTFQVANLVAMWPCAVDRQASFIQGGYKTVLRPNSNPIDIQPTCTALIGGIVCVNPAGAATTVSDVRLSFDVSTFSQMDSGIKVAN